MGLITNDIKVKWVETELNSNTMKYYENLGYCIPKLLNKQNKYTTPEGTKILVRENDLFIKRLIGKKYGMLTIVDYDYKRSEESYNKKEYYKFWLCKCDCGNEELVSINQMNLLTGKSTSCGCMFKKRRNNLIGNSYGKLIVIKLDEERTNKDKTFWLCKCNCGNPNLISIESDSLKRGATQSCGCYWKYMISGENSHYWKGGITELYQHLRNKIEPWIVETFIKYNRKCVITNKPAEVVHHLINFSDIVMNSLNELNLPIYKSVNEYTAQEIIQLENLVIDKHYYYDCGIPLLDDVHTLFHKTYGYKNNTIYQFKEFVDKIYKKEVQIPYTVDDKRETWKQMIDDKIKEINEINIK